MTAMSRALAVSRERPHALIAALALFLLLTTVLLKISVPMVALGIVVLAAALVTLMRPEIGLHVLVLNALIGLTHVVDPPRIGPVSAPVLIEAAVMSAMLFQMAFARRRIPFATLQHALLGLLAVWIFVSLLWGTQMGPENFRDYRNLFLIRLVMFLLVTGLITTREGVRRLIVTFMISNVGLLSVAAAVRLGWFGQERISTSQNFERTGALVQNPNELAFHLTTMLVLTIFTWLHARRPFPRALLLGLAVADLLGILSTLSRSGFISMCVVVLFLLFRLTRNVRAVTAMLVLALVGWLMMPQELFARFAGIDEVRDVDRVQVAQVGLAMALDNPLTGVGLGNYVVNFWNYNVSNMRRAAPSHNMYLDLAAQMGLPALALYLAVLWITWRGLRAMEKDLVAAGDRRSFSYLYGLALQAFLVNLAVFGLSGDVEFDYAVFVMLGMAVTLIQWHRRQTAEATGGRSAGADEGVGASGRN